MESTGLFSNPFFKYYSDNLPGLNSVLASSTHYWTWFIHYLPLRLYENIHCALLQLLFISHIWFIWFAKTKPYLSCVLNLNRGSNSTNSVFVSQNYIWWKRAKINLLQYVILNNFCNTRRSCIQEWIWS